MFAAIYKILLDKPITWRDVAIGAVVTTLLFAVPPLPPANRAVFGTLPLEPAPSGDPMGTPPQPFALGDGTRHLCIDMQRLFAEETSWQVPWLPKVLPSVEQIASRHPARTIFTRFMPPASSDPLRGAWRDYYAAWPDLMRDRLDPALLELVAPLAGLVPPAKVIDKSVNSVFSRTGFAAALRRRGIDTLVVTGGETDVCVLATVMSAVDLGFRIVLPTDALCSTQDSTHDALIRLYRERFANQIEATSTAEVLDRWR